MIRRIVSIGLAAFILFMTGGIPTGSAAEETTSVFNKAYITSYSSGVVDVMDLENRTVEQAKITVGSSPGSAAVNPDGTQVFITNRGSNTVSVIDPDTDTLMATIDVGTAPHGVAFTSNGSKAYVANDTGNSVSVIDTETLTESAVITGITNPIAAITIDDKVYVSQRTGDITVIDSVTDTVVDTITTGDNLYGMSANVEGSKIYVANLSGNEIYELDVATRTMVAIPVSSNSTATEVSPDGTKVYVAHATANTISVVDTATHVVLEEIAVGNGPYVIGVSSDGGELYTVNYNGGGPGSMSVIDTDTYEVASISGLSNGPFMVGTFMVPVAVAQNQEAPSTNADLSAVTISEGTLTPSFTPDTTSYTANVGAHVDEVTVTASVYDNDATMKIDGNTVVSGNPSPAISLHEGDNAITVAVTAQDGVTEKEYILTITREQKRSSGHGSTPSSVPESSNTNVEVLVNGEVEHAGTATTEEVNGQQVTTVAVDEEKLQQRLEQEGDGAIVTVPVPTASDVVIGELNGRMVKNMEQQQATVELRTEKAAYTLPAQLINIDAVSERFDTNLALQDVKVKIEVAQPSEDRIRAIEAAGRQDGLALVTPPLNFRVTAEYEGRSEEITKFDAYVQRTVAIPEGIDPSQITTGVVVEADGTVRHVPTKIVEVDGVYYAQINSLTNSTYTVVWNPLEFDDMTHHWAKEAVNNMGARMVISGVGDGSFEPDRAITRAEFAAIVVRGLGLQMGQGESEFADVYQTHWFHPAVQTATSYGLIQGFEDGTFRAHDKITREQAVQIIANAMKLTGLDGQRDDRSSAAMLRSYEDAEHISSWARSSMARSIQAGLITGRSEHALAPQHFMTRAEVALLIERLLEESDLI